MRPLDTALLLALCGGCVINSDKWPRPRDLSESWLVDRTRLLAIRAEPPEIRPGGSATFEALLPSPDGEELLKVWFACPVLDEVGFGCILDLGGLDLETTDTGALLELGLIGVEPGFSPVYVAPTDLLDGLDDEAERREGVQVLAQLTALPPDAAEAGGELDFAEVEAGFKRLVVSEATTPNHNPALAELYVDRLAITADAVVHLSPNQSYELGVVIGEASIEVYEYLNSDGVLEERTEEPYVAWYATGGEVLEPYTLYPYTEATWVSPPNPGASGVWYAVLRDRRGGMDWWVQSWVVD